MPDLPGAFMSGRDMNVAPAFSYAGPALGRRRKPQSEPHPSHAGA
jgi:hypothetical protein